jgi:hypothetical protein
MKRVIVALAAWLALTTGALARNETSSLPSASPVAPSDELRLIQPITPSPTNPTGWIDRKASIGDVIAAGGVRIFNADPTGGTDVTAALTAALASNDYVMIPRGLYRLDTPPECNIGSYKSKMIFGNGVDSTVLYWPSPGGMTCNFTDQGSSIHLRDLTFATGSASGGVGLTLYQHSPWLYPGMNVASDLTNVTFRGSSGYADGTRYWSVGIAIYGVSNVNFTGVVVTGPVSTPGGLGKGVTIQGFPNSDNPSNPYYAVVYNFVQSAFNQVSTGIEVGSYVQGIFVTASNFTGVRLGIYVPFPASGAQSQWLITSNQFAIQGSGCATAPGCGAFYAASSVFDLHFANNEINNGAADAIILRLESGSEGIFIDNNYFIGSGAGSASQIANLSGSFGNWVTHGSITNNKTNGISGAWPYGVVLGTYTDYISIIGNDFSYVPTPITNYSGGPHMRFVDNFGYNPQGQVGTTLTASPQVITAGSNPETDYISQSSSPNAQIFTGSGMSGTSTGGGGGSGTCTGNRIGLLTTVGGYATINLEPNTAYCVTWSGTAPGIMRDIH